MIANQVLFGFTQGSYFLSGNSSLLGILLHLLRSIPDNVCAGKLGSEGSAGWSEQKVEVLFEHEAVADTYSFLPFYSLMSFISGQLKGNFKNVWKSYDHLLQIMHTHMHNDLQFATAVHYHTQCHTYRNFGQFCQLRTTLSRRYIAEYYAMFCKLVSY